MTRGFVIVWLLMLPTLGLAQHQDWWADINLYKPVSEKVTLFIDGGPRVNAGSNSALFYMRPSVSHALSKSIMAGGGGAWFYQHSKNGSIHEVRGWQGIKIEQRVFKRIIVSNYTRLEERFFFDSGDHEFVLRFRTLFGATFLINHTAIQKGTWYVPLSCEIFEDLNDHENMFFNRRRFYSGLGYGINNQTRVELFYIANEVRPNTETDFETTDVIRLRIHYTFSRHSDLN